MIIKTARLIKDNIVPVCLVTLYLIIADSLFGYVCPSMILIGLPCPGCGLTRAALSLLAFDFGAAYVYNPMIFAVLPLLFTYYLLWIKGGNTRALFLPATALILVSVVVFAMRFSKNAGVEPFVINRGSVFFRLLK